MEKETKGTKENHTHIRFYYNKHKITVNKFTYEHGYPDKNREKSATKIEYIIRTN